MTAMKGRRKTTRNVPVGIKIGRYVLPPQIVIAGLLSLLYVCFLLGGSYNGRDIVVQLIYFALFGVMIFVLRASQRYYTKLAYAFLVLAIPPMLWYVVEYLGYGPASPELGWYLWVGLVSLVLGLGLTAALQYYDKSKLSDIYVKVGNLKEDLRTGATVLVASVVLTGGLCRYTLRQRRHVPALAGHRRPGRLRRRLCGGGRAVVQGSSPVPSRPADRRKGGVRSPGGRLCRLRGCFHLHAQPRSGCTRSPSSWSPG